MDKIINFFEENLSKGNCAFANKDWNTAIKVYRQCSEALDKLWLSTFYPSSEIRSLTEGLSTRLAYALVSVGQERDAVLAIENGKARYLTRLLIQKTDTTKFLGLVVNDENYDVVQGYLAVAACLTDLHSERSSPSLRGRAAMALSFLHAIKSRLTTDDLKEFTRLQDAFLNSMQNELFANQVKYVLPKVLQGVDPTTIQYYEPNEFESAKSFKLAYHSLLKKYDIPELIENPKDKILEMERKLEALSSKLPITWLWPSWQEVEEAVGVDSQAGGAYFDPGAQPLVYLFSTAHGSMAIIVEPERYNGDRHKINSILIDINEAKIKEFSLLINHFTRNTKKEVSFLDRWKNNDLLGLLIKFWNLILNPIVTVLKKNNYKSVVFIPSGALYALPLHAAIPARNRNALFANEIISISYSPSARLIKRARQTALQLRDKEPNFVGICNPYPSKLPPLQFAEREVEVISAHFFKRWGIAWMSPRILKGKDAMRFSMSGYLNGEYQSIIHFACHAYFDVSDVLKGGVMLSEDEPLSLGDVLKQQSELRLSVLSCCDSGLIDNKQIDEAIGFSGGLLAAGSAGVISTLWPISDLGTSLLMIRFYDAWLDENLSPASALAKAQSWMAKVPIAEKISYFSDDRFGRWEGQMPKEEYERLLSNWKELRNGLARDKKLAKTFLNPIYWAGFFYTGV